MSQWVTVARMNKGLHPNDLTVAQKNAQQLKDIEEAKRAVAARGGAYQKLNRALKRGDLVRPDACEGCGKVGKVDGHHDDYLYPLVVRWLCRRCHKGLHPYERSDTITPMPRRKFKTNNEALKYLMKRWGLSQKQVIALSQRSRTLVYQWTREPDHQHYVAMHPADLRLIKLELEIEAPKGKPEPDAPRMAA